MNLALKDLVNYFAGRYYDKYRIKYPIVWGRDSAIMKRLTTYYTQDQLLRLIDDYFQTNDTFIVTAGHSLTLLPRRATNIVAQWKKRKDSGVIANPDAVVIAEARKITEFEEE